MQIHQSPRLTWRPSPQKINKHQLATPAVCLFRIGLDRADEAVRVRPILLEERSLLDPLKSKFVHAEVTRSQLKRTNLSVSKRRASSSIDMLADKFAHCLNIRIFRHRPLDYVVDENLALLVLNPLYAL